MIDQSGHVKTMKSQSRRFKTVSANDSMMKIRSSQIPVMFETWGDWRQIWFSTHPIEQLDGIFHLRLVPRRRDDLLYLLLLTLGRPCIATKH
jgi:hypothetical protein